MPSDRNTRKEFDWTRGALPAWAKMVIGVAVVLLVMLVMFRVRSFEVSGNVRYTAEEVAEASGITEGDILMGVNKTQVASRLIARLPYVEQVVIEKVLPGTIKFEVTECTAAAIVTSEFSTIWLMSESGKLLEKIEETNRNRYPYPEVTGTVLSLPTAGEQAVYEDYDKGTKATELLDAVRRAGLEQQITEINVENLQDLVVIYEDRVEVQLGMASDVDYQLEYLKAVIGKIGATERGILDLRFSVGEEAIFHRIV